MNVILPMRGEGLERETDNSHKQDRKVKQSFRHEKRKICDRKVAVRIYPQNKYEYYQKKQMIWHQWLMPITLATQEADIRLIVV
jgi:hypothetical protein